jgi:hypothetical protein
MFSYRLRSLPSTSAVISSAWSPRVHSRLSVAAHSITQQLSEFCTKPQTSVKQGSLLYPSRHLALHTLQAVALLMQLPSMEFRHRNELLAVAFMLTFISQLYFCFDKNGPPRTVTDCIQWRHPSICGRPSDPLGKRTFVLFAFALAHSPDAR